MRAFRHFATLALCAASVTIPAQRSAVAAHPSFLCAKASTWVENTICASDRLSELDMEMASSYARLLRTPDAGKRSALTREQSQWWSLRASCKTAPDPSQCLESAYAARIAALKARPDYPGDAPVRAPKIVQEASIRAAEVGWARRLSEYAKAIGTCTRQARQPVRAVLTAWMEPRDEKVGMWLLSADEGQLRCVVSKDGKILESIRARHDQEQVPVEGPVLHLVATAEKCPNAVPVADVEGRPFGWLTVAPCPAE